MLKWMCVVGCRWRSPRPAFAQKTDLPDRPAKQTTPFDIAAMKEGNTLLKATAPAPRSTSSRPRARPRTSRSTARIPKWRPMSSRTIETGEWEPEIFDDEFFDSDPIRQHVQLRHRRGRS